MYNRKIEDNIDVFEQILYCGYDDQLKQILAQRQLNWLPWVGICYDKYRVMLVAESHVCGMNGGYDQADYDGFLNDAYATRGIVSEAFIKREYTVKTYENMIRMLTGVANIATLSREQRELLLSKLAFMNVIQKPMCKARNERPSLQDFEQGACAVLDVVQVIKPDLCIIGSVGSAGYIYNRAKIVGCRVDAMDWGPLVGRIRGRTFVVRHNGHACRFVIMQQAGKYFSWRKWRKYVFNWHADLGNKMSSLL